MFLECHMIGVSPQPSPPPINTVQQFRMAPTLCSLVSRLYYDDRLKDNEGVVNNGPVTEGYLKPLLLINVTGTTMEYNRGHNSFENKAEAEVVKVVYEFLFSSKLQLGDEDLTSKDVCVLTPYNRHKDILRKSICNIEEDALDSYAGLTYSSTPQTPVKRGNTKAYTPLRSPKKAQAILGTQEEVDPDIAAKVENIDTVDKFQGSERKAVIISTCADKKPNPHRESDPHFINVACSRAKHLLVIIGNFTVRLASNGDWQEVKSHAKDHGCYIEHEVTKLSDHLYNINEDSLVGKLEELVGRPTKRGRVE